MQPADLAAARSRDTGLPSNRVRLCGWGAGEGVDAELIRTTSDSAARWALERARAEGLGAIARGLGRSYGDAAQLAGGLVLETSAMTGFHLDTRAGTVTAQAGATLGQLLGPLSRAGWILPVVPGTQHVTIAGAIASDIHGKNHRSAGTFGMYVRALGLLRADGEVVELTPDGPGRDLLDATIGGMGLTGMILWATIGLVPISSPTLSVDTDRVESIDEALQILSGPGGPHRVAWIDLLSARPARGVVTRAEFVDSSDGTERATVRARASVPAAWPAGVLRAGTVRAYNELRFRRTPRRAREHLEGFGVHMFPLDVLDHWPRLYGPTGFLQYQLVVPTGQEAVLDTVVHTLRRSRVPCFLAVLKDFGEENRAPLSFPLAGWTLTLDLPRAAPGLDDLLRAFDELIANAGGRVYLSKDARLPEEMLGAMYPRLSQWRAAHERVDPEHLWRSDLAIRTGLVNPASA